MSEGTNQRVECQRCRYRYFVDVGSTENWSVEAECPSCESRARFTSVDTQDKPPPTPEELAAQDAVIQRRGELLWRPINANRDHPAVAWMDGVGNGFFEDDYNSRIDWLIPHAVYRFTREGSGAYVWEEEGTWVVRGWHPLLDCGNPPEPVAVDSFRAALDRLTV